MKTEMSSTPPLPVEMCKFFFSDQTSSPTCLWLVLHLSVCSVPGEGGASLPLVLPGLRLLRPLPGSSGVLVVFHTLKHFSLIKF